MSKDDASALVWFRRDLRLRDNPALHGAAADNANVIPVYVHRPQEEAPWEPGAASRWWLHHSLQDLAEHLRRRGSGLVLRTGDSARQLVRLAEETGARSVYWNRLYEPAAIRRDGEVERLLRREGLTVKTFNASLLTEFDEALNRSGEPYRVFTPFYKANVHRVIQASEKGAVPSLRNGAMESVPSAGLLELGLLPEPDWADGLRACWKPGESGAAERLDEFCDSALFGYGEERDRPDRAGVSRLSPHLHFGEVAVARVWRLIEDRAREHGRESEAEPYLRQLMWREFSYHLLFHFPNTPDSEFNDRFAGFPWRNEDDSLFEAWCRGRTGIPLVDAGMRELWRTGWMHNRVRMNVASFLTKHCLIDWRAGARWFWDTLVDADLANNTMGWQWSAGCGADASPFFRIFNPVRQGERFDPGGDYVRRWVPELDHLSDSRVHSPWSASGGNTAGYPPPVVDLAAGRRRALAAYEGVKASSDGRS